MKRNEMMENRMNFQTSVELPAGMPSVSHADHILLMGSCFAENIGRQLMDAGFQLDLNPFGILYNPLSVSSALREIIRNKEYNKQDLFAYKDLWHSPMHHGSFSAFTPEETLHTINSRLHHAYKKLPELNWLIVTMGTAYVYKQKESGQVVANCHQLPESHFLRYRLSVEEIVEDYTALITEMSALSPDLKCGICGEHGGEPSSVKFCHRVGLNYVSCSPFRVPIARLAAAQAAIEG